MAQHIRHRADFDQVRYANCWEDAWVLCEALQPAAGKRILSIASAGDNVLALLAAGAEVVAADLSAAQLACLELRVAAFRHLDHPQLLGFLGIAPERRRRRTYEQKLAGELSAPSRAFWDSRRHDIETGVVHAGKFEHYFRRFRRYVLPCIHSRATVRELLAEKSRAERLAFYERKWNTLRWRMLFQVFFSRRVMGRLGRDPEFFRYVEGSVAQRILQRTKHALTELPTHNNPYLRYILTGNFDSCLPKYLRPEHVQAIRQGLDRLTLFHGTVEEAARIHRGPGFDGFNLSDIFEYLDASICEEVFTALLESAVPGARFAYWNMLVPRHHPPPCASRIRPLDELARRLHERDLAFFYSALVVEEVA